LLAVNTVAWWLALTHQSILLLCKRGCRRRHQRPADIIAPLASAHHPFAFMARPTKLAADRFGSDPAVIQVHNFTKRLIRPINPGPPMAPIAGWFSLIVAVFAAATGSLAWSAVEFVYWVLN